MIGYWDENLWKQVKCKRDEECVYFFKNPDEYGFVSYAGHDINFIKIDIAINDYGFRLPAVFDEQRYTTLLKRFFGMNDAQAKIMWDRTYPYATAEGKKNEEGTSGSVMYYKAATEPMLMPVRYVINGCPETEHTLGV